MWQQVDYATAVAMHDARLREAEQLRLVQQAERDARRVSRAVASRPRTTQPAAPWLGAMLVQAAGLLRKTG